MIPGGKPLCVVLGGGGHASMLVEILQALGDGMQIVILDADPDKRGQSLLGEKIAGGDELLPDLARQGATHFVVGLGAVSDNRPRKRLFEKGLSHGLEPMTLIHPSAVCSKWSRIGRGSMLLPGSIVNAGVSLGVNVIVNSGAIVEHDCIIQDHAHIATGARLASTVRVGACAHVGLGAAVRQGVTLGEGAVIGAGAVVLADVAAGTVVAGVPARPLKRRQ